MCGDESGMLRFFRRSAADLSHFEAVAVLGHVRVDRDRAHSFAS